MEPNRGCSIDSVTTGQTAEDNLSRASHYAGSEQYEHVPPRIGLPGGLQEVGSGAVPNKVLHHFQQPGERRRSYTCTDTC
jgi:hypothetical protein